MGDEYTEVPYGEWECQDPGRGTAHVGGPQALLYILRQGAYPLLACLLSLGGRGATESTQLS